jgi:hypothetical protein
MLHDPMSHSYGSGSLITLHHPTQGVQCAVLTCKHVVPTIQAAEHISLRTGYLRHDAGAVHSLLPVQLYISDAANDVCLCACDAACPAHSIRVGKVSVRQTVTVLQHPNAAPATVVDGRVTRIDRDAFEHTADTLPGSSGAGIFTMSKMRPQTWHLVGVHCGADEDRPINLGFRVNALFARAASMGWRITR